LGQARLHVPPSAAVALRMKNLFINLSFFLDSRRERCLPAPGRRGREVQILMIDRKTGEMVTLGMS
jgi:hypothetical protein